MFASELARTRGFGPTWFGCLCREETSGVFSTVAATAVQAAAAVVPKYHVPEGQPRLGFCSRGAVQRGVLGSPRASLETPMKEHPWWHGDKVGGEAGSPLSVACTVEAQWSPNSQMKKAEFAPGALEEALALLTLVRSRLGRGFLWFLVSNKHLTSEPYWLLWG